MAFLSLKVLPDFGFLAAMRASETTVCVDSLVRTEGVFFSTCNLNDEGQKRRVDTTEVNIVTFLIVHHHLNCLPQKI